MPSQIDYVIAAGVFLGAFLFVTTFVSNYSASSFNALETTNLREGALSILNSVGRNEGGLKITDIGLGTDAYAFQLQVSGGPANESSSFRLSEVGFGNADKNSVTIYNDDGDIIPYSLSGDIFTFNADIPSGGKTITVWFDDDSSFSSKSSAIPILTDDLPHELFQVEKSRVVQYRLLEDLQSKSYDSVKEDFDFRIRLITTTGFEHFAYGQTPPQANVIALQTPTLFQNQNAEVIKGYMIAEVW